ncbi:MAG: DNA (cytosine-5-)-methyltransferase [Clostridia bacterium]|nr:DNA (cytosine-5-)-methyltransferase [Clostridia bacterium]
MKYELVSFCEIDSAAITSYCAIHNESKNKNIGDIQTADENIIKPFNFMVGGTPCQDFSIGGNRKGAVWKCLDCGNEYNPLTVKNEDRNKCPVCESENLEKTRSSLLVEWLRILKKVKPDIAIYENVKNILSKKFEMVFLMFKNEIEEYGYNVYFKVLNSKDYGIPQNRERLYMVIIKKTVDNGLFRFPEKPNIKPCLRDFLNPADKTQFEECKTVQNIFIDQTIKPSVRLIYERDSALIKKSNKDIFQCICKSGFQDCKVGIKVAPTLRAGNPHTVVFDGKHIRRLLPIEAFRLMGFTDSDFEKCKLAGVSDSQIYKQSGNSIVVDVLAYIYLELYKAMPYLFDDVKLGSFFSGIGAFEKAFYILKKRINTKTVPC